MAHVINGERYLGTREAAEVWGVTFDTVKRWRAAGFRHAPYIKIGSTALYRERDVQAFASTYVNRLAR